MRYLLLIVLAIPVACRADDAKAKPASNKVPATDILATAMKDAKAGGKAVFLEFSSPSCSWCRVLERYHARAAVKNIISRHLVLANVDIVETPGGDKLYAKYADPASSGVPVWVILATDGKILADSFDTSKDGKKQNVGFPATTEELAHYEKALRTALPKLSEADLATLMTELKDARPKAK